QRAEEEKAKRGKGGEGAKRGRGGEGENGRGGEGARERGGEGARGRRGEGAKAFPSPLRHVTVSTSPPLPLSPLPSPLLPSPPLPSPSRAFSLCPLPVSRVNMSLPIPLRSTRCGSKPR